MCFAEQMETLYEAVGEQAGLSRLASAWNERCLADPLVVHPFRLEGRDDHVELLTAYWTEAFGGPAHYTARHGSEGEVIRRDADPGEKTETETEATAVDCFAAALDDVGFEGRSRETLLAYFRWSARRPVGASQESGGDVPAALDVPRWGWHGPVPTSLHGIRAAIDELDHDFVALIARRQALVLAAGALKRSDSDVRAPDRVEQVVARVRHLAEEAGAAPGIVEGIYRGMIDTFITYELSVFENRR